MRKIFMFTIVFLLSITLVGCDYLSQDIQDQISEELCKNDPDHELCDLESIDNLEDEIVMNLLEELLQMYNTDDYQEKCTEYISPSNPDLLDKCREMSFMFLPEDVDMFTPKTVVKEDNTYLITGEHNLMDKELTIKLVIVEVEGKHYIEEYSYMVEEKEVLTEITKEIAFEFFKNYLMALADKDITSEDFCTMYYRHGGIDDDCDDDPDDFRLEYSGFESIEPTEFADSKVHGHVTVLKLSGETEEFDVTMELMLDDNGAVYVYKFYTDEGIDEDCDGVCEVDDRSDVILIYEKYLQDYLNKDITDDELTDMYFMEMMDASFYEIRKEVQNNKYRSVHDIVGPYKDGSFLILLLEEDEMGSRIMKDKIKVMKRIDKATPLLMILDEDSDDDSIPIDERRAFVSGFSELANRHSIASDSLCMMYFPEDSKDECIALHSSLIEMSYEIYETEFIEDMYGNSFIRLRQRPDILSQEWDELLDEYLVYVYYDPTGKMVMELVSIPDKISFPEM